MGKPQRFRKKPCDGDDQCIKGDGKAQHGQVFHEGLAGNALVGRVEHEHGQQYLRDQLGEVGQVVFLDDAQLPGGEPGCQNKEEDGHGVERGLEYHVGVSRAHTPAGAGFSAVSGLCAVPSGAAWRAAVFPYGGVRRAVVPLGMPSHMRRQRLSRFGISRSKYEILPPVQELTHSRKASGNRRAKRQGGMRRGIIRSHDTLEGEVCSVV